MSTLEEKPHALSRRTTPTWEVELLISGVAVFAMLQLLGWLDDAFLQITPRVAGDWRQLVLLIYFYVKSAALILSVTFVLHLLLRARWIALVGMHSVHPDGIRWDKLKVNPIQREVEQSFDRSLPEHIERADNLATTVFAIGVMLSIMMGAIAICAIVISMASTFFAFISGDRLHTEAWVWILLFAFVLPFGIAAVVDHSRGAIWPKEHLGRRVVRGLLEIYVRIGFGRGGNPIMALMASQGGDRKAILLTMGVITLSLIAAGLGALQLSRPNLIGNYGMFPDPGSALPRIDSAHYDNQRNPLRDGTVPYIPTLVASGPYLELVIPYQPRLDEPAMRRICSQADELEKQAKGKARLDCLASLHPVSLDGRTLANLRYDVATDSRADRPALLAMIDIRMLAVGRHELRIGRAPPATDEPIRKGSKAERDAQDYVIPFWK